MKVSIKDFSKCDHIGSFLRIWSHLPKKSLMENIIFCVVVAIKWFKGNTMIVNPGKFQAKNENNHTQEIIKIDNKAVNVKTKLNFSLHTLHTVYLTFPSYKK